ncbi:hydroxyacid dehydrogenase [Tessaracoccus terricola]
MVLTDDALARLAGRAHVVDTEGAAWDAAELPADASALVTGWGTPLVGDEVLGRMPGLQLFAHTGGSVRPVLDADVWTRGVRVTTSAETNNQFVAEYAGAQVLLALKGAHHVVAYGRSRHRLPGRVASLGTRRQRVGLVSYGSIARRVREELRRLEAEVWVWDPYVTDEDLARDGVHRAPDLETLFASCLVVSIHTPLIPGVTEGLVGAAQLELLQPGATLLNTARGAIVDEPALVDLLRRRLDVCAVLDVTWPEPPEPRSALWDLPNAQVTGHVAGAIGTEAFALGDNVVAEVLRHFDGEPLRCEVSADAAALRA